MFREMDDNKQNNVRMENGGGRDGSLWNIRLMIKSLKQVDGYFFGTITELLVMPEYQKHGIGSRLLQLAKEASPTMLYFGAQPGVDPFYEKNGQTSYICKQDCFLIK